MTRPRLLAVLTIALGLTLGACGNGGDDEATADDPAVVSVLAADQIDEVVTTVVDAYRQDHPDADISVVAKGQSDMIDAVSDNEADVAVLPDVWLNGADTDAQPGSFGRNLAVIAVASGNPKNIAGPSAFGNDGLRTLVCGTDTAVGNFSVMVLAKSGVDASEAEVESGCEDDAVRRVADGDLDAALVFRNGVRVPDGVDLIEIPEDKNLVFDLSYVVLNDSATASAFGDFLASDETRRILVENGYLP